MTELLTRKQIAEKYGLSLSGVSSGLQYRGVQPVCYRKRQGRPTPLYDADVVAASLTHPQVPDGWMKIAELSKELGYSEDFLLRTVRRNGMPSVHIRNSFYYDPEPIRAHFAGRTHYDDILARMKQRGYVTAAEASKLTGIEVNNLRRYIRQKKLAGVVREKNYPRRYFIPLSELEVDTLLETA